MINVVAECVWVCLCAETDARAPVVWGRARPGSDESRRARVRARAGFPPRRALARAPPPTPPTTTTTTMTMSTSSMRARRAMPRAVFARTVRGTTRRASDSRAVRARVDKAGPKKMGRGRRATGAWTGRRERDEENGGVGARRARDA